MALTHLADTSVLKRLANPTVRAIIEPLAQAGHLARPTICDLEIGYSARNADEWALYENEVGVPCWLRHPLHFAGYGRVAVAIGPSEVCASEPALWARAGLGLTRYAYLAKRANRLIRRRQSIGMVVLLRR